MGRLVEEKFELVDPNKKKNEVATFGGKTDAGENNDIEEEEDTSGKKLLDSNSDRLDAVGNDGSRASEKAD